jgi:hypothetical protein
MARAGAVAVVVAAAVLAGCGGDAGSTGSSAPSSTTCDGCRTLRVGTDARLDGTSIGVRRCDRGSCSLALAAADGTETRRTVGPGDTIGVWHVESVSAEALVLRRS